MKVKILKVERLKNSVNGNPRYELCVLNEKESFIKGKTATDSILGYKIDSNWEGSTRDLEIRFTKKTGRAVFCKEL